MSTRSRAHSGGGTATDGVVTGSLVMLAARVDQLGHRASALVQAFHSDNPLRPGMPKASLASQLGIEPEALTAVLARSDGLEERGVDDRNRRVHHNAERRE